MKRLGIAKMIVVGMLMVAVSSCDQRSCSNVTCQSWEQCVDGVCLCPDGYEGSDCTTESRTKYAGQYLVYEQCNGSVLCNFCNYQSYITLGTSVNQIQINNLFGQGFLAYANIITDGTNQGNSIYIPYQTQGSIAVEGSGTFNIANKSLTLDLNYQWQGGSVGCRHTFYPN